MITLLLILSVINTTGLAVILISKFKEKFVIVDLDTYNLLLEFWGQYHDEEGNELNRELAGGTGTPYYGFFQDYIDEPDEEEEQEE